jgi:NTE family protein
VRIDGEPYWDGGIFSNTPIEVVMEDKPRLDSMIFTVHLWNPVGPEPESIWQVGGREKDIQFASRATAHIERQRQIHRLRRIIRELESHLHHTKRKHPHVKVLTEWGCGTTMHVARLMAPRLPGEDQTKDIDFTPAGIRARRAAGLADTRRALKRAPWWKPTEAMEGVIVHEFHPAG